MSLRNRISGLGAVALAVMLLISMVGGVAAISTDTETSTTSTTTEVTGGSTISLNATSSTKHKLQLVNATADASAKFKKDIDGDGTKEVVATFDDFQQVSGDHYKTNITDSEIRQRVPITADGQADSFSVKLINDTTLNSPATKTITVSTNASGVSTVQIAKDDYESKQGDKIPILNQNLIGPKKTVSFEAENIPAGAGDVVIVEAENGTVSSQITGFVPSDASSGAVVPMTVMVNDKPQEVYYKTAPDGASGTYTVLQSDGDIEVHLADDFSKDSVDVNAADTTLGIQQAFDVYGISLKAVNVAINLPF